MISRKLFAVASSLTSCAALVLAGGAAHAQSSLNPNPLLPSGVGSASDVDFGRAGRGGGRLGRDISPSGRVEANPADTLLKDINGTNNGRRTGRGVFNEFGRRTTGYRGVMPTMKDGAYEFSRRGSYEEAIYGTRRGSYTNFSRRRGRNG